MSISSLPKELFSLIFNQLDGLSLQTARQVCKGWQKMVRDTLSTLHTPPSFHPTLAVKPLQLPPFSLPNDRSTVKKVFFFEPFWVLAAGQRFILLNLQTHKKPVIYPSEMEALNVMASDTTLFLLSQKGVKYTVSILEKNNLEKAIPILNFVGADKEAVFLFQKGFLGFSPKPGEALIHNLVAQKKVFLPLEAKTTRILANSSYLITYAPETRAIHLWNWEGKPRGTHIISQSKTSGFICQTTLSEQFLAYTTFPQAGKLSPTHFVYLLDLRTCTLLQEIKVDQPPQAIVLQGFNLVLAQQNLLSFLDIRSYCAEKKTNGKTDFYTIEGEPLNVFLSFTGPHLQLFCRYPHYTSSLLFPGKPDLHFSPAKGKKKKCVIA